ncbi:MAG: hypothetical protein HQK51_18070 [Oligoflexia bacterium]|nr:hypothetical protein [Oligoflexia bacterium]
MVVHGEDVAQHCFKIPFTNREQCFSITHYSFTETVYFIFEVDKTKDYQISNIKLFFKKDYLGLNKFVEKIIPYIENILGPEIKKFVKEKIQNYFHWGRLEWDRIISWVSIIHI